MKRVTELSQDTVGLWLCQTGCLTGRLRAPGGWGVGDGTISEGNIDKTPVKMWSRGSNSARQKSPAAAQRHGATAHSSSFAAPLPHTPLLPSHFCLMHYKNSLLSLITATLPIYHF